MLVNTTQAIFIEGVSVSAAQQRATTRAFPLSVLLLEVPWFELSAAPAEIFRGNPAQGCKSRDAEPRENQRRNLIKQSCPATEAPSRFVIEFTVGLEQMG